MQRKQFIALGGLILTAHAALADPILDTSMPLICAATEVVNCSAAGDCTRSTPDAFNLPVLFKIDIPNKVANRRASAGRSGCRRLPVRPKWRQSPYCKVSMTPTPGPPVSMDRLGR
jgi:hypothetical protein